MLFTSRLKVQIGALTGLSLRPVRLCPALLGDRFIGISHPQLKVFGDNQTDLTQCGKNQFLIGHCEIHAFLERKWSGPPCMVRAEALPRALRQRRATHVYTGMKGWECCLRSMPWRLR